MKLKCMMQVTRYIKILLSEEIDIFTIKTNNSESWNSLAEYLS